ncbi:MAG: hypothetical protein CMP05_12985 [Xanthomarina sp.]|mgnify:FL=1|uniref:DUF6048 family protein n=1 Tax=Xanthomarina TaxID=1868329 RepID=UPI000C4ACA51|nr:DUF6048 family protein [Xanthomarina sp.]MAL21701.1 hypothetical protein [Xanthomarina sp.]MBF62896.1 hypothetical protein [Xanthomarina sp.]HAI19504.1 hypothetical protein [Xanthomarina gelatinilytica]
MKMTFTIKYIINPFIAILFFCTIGQAQNDSIVSTKTDSLKYKESYGLRLGGDLGKLIRSFIDDEYKGFEINADFRLTKKWYVAGEIGVEEKDTDNDYLNATTQGSYFKAGVDYNAYENWYGMENMIYGGFRVGASTFSQTLNSYGVYAQDQYWSPQLTSNESQKFSGLSALWGEFIVGLKVEVLNNLYLGLNAQFKYLISQDQPDNFENLYIPGFQKTYDSGGFGFGYGYSISYLIPFYKKNK